MERKSKIKLFLLKTLIFKVVYGSLCVYNSQGTLKFDDLTLKDIEYAYSKLEYFIGNNPFNTYFGDCVNDQELVNIFGIQAQKNHHGKEKRSIHQSYFDQYDLEKGKVCNLLVGQEANSNPYSKELTGLINPNVVEGWKAVPLANVNIAGGSSISLSKAYSFDDIYSVSVQESSLEKDAYPFEKDDFLYLNENNFCSVISKIMEKSLLKSMANEKNNHWKDSVMEHISKTNENYSKEYWYQKDSSSPKANMSDESKGTSDEYIAGNSENNGGSSVKSEFVSISESMLQSNLDVQSIKNSIERSTSNEVNYVAHANSTLDYPSESVVINYDFNSDINGGDDTCDVELLKKVTKIFNVVSCHDLDDEEKASKNSKSLEITEIDFQLLEQIQKANTSSKGNKEITLGESFGNSIPQMLYCSNQEKEKVSFLPEDNEFIQVKKVMEKNDGINSFYHILPSYLELSSSLDDRHINTIKNTVDDRIATILTNDNGDIILKKGRNLFFNTQTGAISEKAILRISKKNHLEVYVNEEGIFEPVGKYASEFENVNYAVFPVVNETLSIVDAGYDTYIFHVDKRNTKDLEKLLDPSHFNVPEAIVWSSVRPEHQHLTVGWSGNEDGNENSYLFINTYRQNDSTSYDGMTLYDPNGIPIWKFDINKNNEYLDSHGYYLPFKYGYPFKNEEITKNIPKKYAEKNYPYLTIPDNVTYKGNTLYFGGCNHHLTSGNGKLEGLISENGRFRLILKEDGNLVFKDHYVTIWESKTSNLWQGKAPYTLIVGNDGVMRILNSQEDVIMSTLNKESEPSEGSSNYRLEVLNAGTFRIVNEKGEEVWNMWNHADHHEFNIYLEKVTYHACENQYPSTNNTTTVITKYSTSISTEYSTITVTKTRTNLVTRTKRSYETYNYVTYLGTVGSRYILGVNDLKEYSTIYARYGGILNKNESKYTKWLVKSIADTPSKMILADDNGNLSDYCLDVGSATGNSYYLAIKKCSNARYLFKYYKVPLAIGNGKDIKRSPIIAIYKSDNTLLTNNKGTPYCIYYSDILYIKECKHVMDYPNYKWATVVGRNKKHIHTSTETIIETRTIDYTTHTVKSSVVTSLSSTIYTTAMPLTTNDIPSSTSFTSPTNYTGKTTEIPVTITSTKYMPSKTSTVTPTNNNN